jgi:hypothetical protein
MITLSGKHYAKDQIEAIRLLKEHGEAFAGFYRVNLNGILFLDRQRVPFAFAAMDPTNGGTFFVTAHRIESGTYEGRTRYMYGLGDYTATALGIDAWPQNRSGITKGATGNCWT